MIAPWHIRVIERDCGKERCGAPKAARICYEERDLSTPHHRLVTAAGVHVDSDASAVAAANYGAHGRGIAADTDHGKGRHLRDVDAVEPWVSRHRVRVLRLGDGLDQH